MSGSEPLENYVKAFIRNFPTHKVNLMFADIWANSNPKGSTISIEYKGSKALIKVTGDRLTSSGIDGDTAVEVVEVLGSLNKRDLFIIGEVHSDKRTLAPLDYTQWLLDAWGKIGKQS